MKTLMSQEPPNFLPSFNFGLWSNRGSSRGFRSPRGTRGTFRSRGTFRGRGRGSDSYFESGRGTYTRRASFQRGGSSYRGRDDSFDTDEIGGSSSSKYSGDRYSSSHSRRDEGSHHREVRESASGSFGRDHSSRRDGEPERKRIRSEIGSSYKEGVSPRRSYDDLDHSSNRNYSSSGSPYRSSESSSYLKPHHHRSKEYSDFKKPLPPDEESSYSGSSTRGSRGRGINRALTARGIGRSAGPAFLKRSAIGRITRLRPAIGRGQLLLRKKRTIRAMRARKVNDMQDRPLKKDEDVINTSEEEDFDDMYAEEAAAEELDQSIAMSEEDSAQIEGDSGEEGTSEVKKPTPVKKKAESLPENESSKKEERRPSSSLQKNFITLKCIHCKTQWPTFKRYLIHLSSFKHKKAMQTLVFELKQKLRRMRKEQRTQQRIIDEQNDDFAKTSYCKVCKLNYKQSKLEHLTSDHHIDLNEFLNPKCSICRLSFATPILYENHRCTLNHIKRKAFLEKEGIDFKDADNEDENNEEDNFMVLDSVGSADEDEDENDETPADTSGVKDTEDTPKPAVAKKKKLPKVIGADFIKRVPVYYCKLCRLCLPYNPNTNQEDLLLAHCRGRFHLKRYSIEKLRKTKEKAKLLKKNKQNKLNKTKVEAPQNGTVEANDSSEANDSYWDPETEAETHKSSDEEEASNRYDRFGHSEELENVNAAGNSDSVEGNDAKEPVASQA